MYKYAKMIEWLNIGRKTPAVERGGYPYFTINFKTNRSETSFGTRTYTRELDIIISQNRKYITLTAGIHGLCGRGVGVLLF